MTNLILGDRVLDMGLTALDTEATHIYVCSNQPTTFLEATTPPSTSPDNGYALGFKNFGAGSAFGSSYSGSPDVDGRLIDSVSLSGGTITDTGVVTYWAATDNSNSRLLASGVLTASGSPAGGNVTAGQTFTLSPLTIRMPALAGGAQEFPLTVSSFFWYDATQGVTVDGSNNVTQWNDLSGGGRHLTDGSVHITTVKQSAIQNGLPGLFFTRSGDLGGSMLHYTGSGFSQTQPFTIIAAFKNNTDLTSFPTLFTDNVNISMLPRDNNIGNQPTLYAGTSVSVYGSALSASTPYILYGRFNGASSSGGWNTNASGTVNPGTNNFSSAQVQIGADVSNQLFFDGWVFEIFAFPSVSDTDRDNALAYLNSKWAIY